MTIFEHSFPVKVYIKYSTEKYICPSWKEFMG